VWRTGLRQPPQKRRHLLIWIKSGRLACPPAAAVPNGPHCRAGLQAGPFLFNFKATTHFLSTTTSGTAIRLHLLTWLPCSKMGMLLKLLLRSSGNLVVAFALPEQKHGK